MRDEARDQLVTIGKAYSGLTDAEIATMTRWFEEHTVSRHGRYRVVEPTVVVEVAFDVILRSNRHKSGFALRFPRIARLRLDKDAREADTLETVDPPVRGPAVGRRASRDRRGEEGRRDPDGAAGLARWRGDALRCRWRPGPGTDGGSEVRLTTPELGSNVALEATRAVAAVPGHPAGTSWSAWRGR